MLRPMLISIDNEIENTTIRPSDDELGCRVDYCGEFEYRLTKLNVKFYLILIWVSVFYNWMTTSNL